MPTPKWPNKLSHREKRVRNEVTTPTDPRHLTSTALESSNQLQPSPASTSGEIIRPFLTTANLTGVANALLNSNKLPQQIASNSKPSAIQKGDNFGL